MRPAADTTFLYDALGSVVGLASTGEHSGLGAYITYEPFGNPIHTNQNVQNYFWFAGGYAVGTLYETEAQGPLHFGERFYSPATTGTWTQRDGIAHPAEPAQYDPYVYVGDNAINGTDPGGTSLIGNGLVAAGSCGAIGFTDGWGLVAAGSICAGSAANFFEELGF
jgi:RHS repeat-associated protein